jgi:DNA-binding response OmpR family regulator
MKNSLEDTRNGSPSGDRRPVNTPGIVLFSPDMDFCVSLRMYLQDRYAISCTTDPDMLLTMVKTLQPGLVIADCLPTERMRERFRVIHAQNPDVKIIFFYFSPFGDRWFREFIRNSGDVAFSKPIDLDEVTRTINSLVMKSCAA